MQEEWQPIETAPKDGTYILIYAKWDWDSMDEPSDYYLALVASYYNDGFWTVTCNPYSDKACEPTHWQPLTEPPRKY